MKEYKNLLSGCEGLSIKVLGLLFLCVITVTFFSLQEPYVAIGPEYIEKRFSCCEQNGWEKSGSGISVIVGETPILQIKSGSHQKVVSVSQSFHIDQQFHLLRFSGELKTRDVKVGGNHWETSRIILNSLNAQRQPIFNIPHVLVSKSGTSDWGKFTKIFNVSDNSDSARISIQMLKTKGVMWVRNLSVVPVKYDKIFMGYQLLFGCIWTVVIFFVFIDFMKKVQLSYFSLSVLLITVIILAGVLMPTSMRTYLYSIIHPFYIEFLPASWVAYEAITPIRVGHFLMFALLTSVLLFKYSLSKQKKLALMFIVLLAIISEILQFLVEGRSPNILDFFADIVGLLIVLIILSVLQFTRINKTNRLNK